MSITRDFKLSLVAGRSVPLVINANQYDDGEVWRFTLLDENGQKYSPSTGSIIGLKSDGHIITNAGTVSSTGLVIIAETEQMTASPGKNFYELLIDDDTHGTANFIVFVEPRPGAGGTPSDSDLAMFQEAIDAAAEIGDVADLVDDVAVLSARMDTFTHLTDGSTTGDAELADIRVGADGTTYPNAGDAVRGQVSDLKNAIDFNTVSGWTSGYYSTGSTYTNVDVETITTNPTYLCSYVSCTEGDVFYYKGYGSSSARPWAFLKSNGDIISRGSAGWYSNERIVAPANATTVIFNAYIENSYRVVIGEMLANRVSSVETKAENNSEDIDDLEESVATVNDKINLLGKSENVKAVGELIQSGILFVDRLTTDEETSAVVRNAQLFECKYPGTASQNGVGVTKNNDGTYTLNGTANANTWFFLNQSTRTGTDNLLSLHGTYSLALEAISGKSQELIIALRDATLTSNAFYVVTYGANISGTGSVDSNNIAVAIQIRNGKEYENFRFRLMVNKGAPQVWVDYKAPITVTNMANLATTAQQFLPSLWIATNDPESTINGSFIVAATNQNSGNRRANIISANHRGYHNGYPENTLWAFAQSKLRGFDWIENDVRFTSDGVGVLLHDESINRTARNADGTAISGTVNIADITYEQACEYDFGIYAGAKFAGTKIVTVAECVAFCKDVGLKILMEPKVSGSGTYCANIVKQYAMEDNVIWISFGAPQLAEVNAVLPKAMVGFVTTQDPSSDHVTTAIGLKTETNKVFLDFDYQKSISGILDSMIANDIGYGVYTLDDRYALASLNPYCFMITSNSLIANEYIANNTLDKWL